MIKGPLPLSIFIHTNNIEWRRQFASPESAWSFWLSAANICNVNLKKCVCVCVCFNVQALNLLYAEFTYFGNHMHTVYVNICNYTCTV